MSQKVIIDTDPGVDDAMALLFALRSPELEILGLTTVFGNAYVEITTENALRLLELEGDGHIPVAKGSGRPLVSAAGEMGMHVHGEDGLGNTYLPKAKNSTLNMPAAQFIVEQIMAQPGEITLIPVGPLTNIAIAVRLEPKIIDRVKEVVIMGGSAFAGGNASPVAEANIYNDPHAAAIVFSAGWPLTMVGLDVTMKSIMKKAYLEEISLTGNAATNLIRDIIPFYQKYHDEIYGMGGGLHTHDPSAIAYVLNPGFFKQVKIPMFVETSGKCAGQTVPDSRNQIGDFAEVNVCLDVDSDELLRLFKERLTWDRELS